MSLMLTVNNSFYFQGLLRMGIPSSVSYCIYNLDSCLLVRRRFHDTNGSSSDHIEVSFLITMYDLFQLITISFKGIGLFVGSLATMTTPTNPTQTMKTTMMTTKKKKRRSRSKKDYKRFKKSLKLFRTQSDTQLLLLKAQKSQQHWFQIFIEINNFVFCSTFNFSVPELTWLAAVLLIVATIVLHFIPMRLLLLIWGIAKFSRRIIRPNTIPNNELLDFLSRVPNDEDIVSILLFLIWLRSGKSCI